MNKSKQKEKRKIRVRAKIKGTKERPRLSVFRSNRFISAQLIDDEKGKTLLLVSEKHLDSKKLKKEKETIGQKTERARKLGLLLGKMAASRKIEAVIFDRGRYTYHGRVKALAEGAREGGLKF